MMSCSILNNQAVIRVFLIDGSSSNFIIKSTHTANAVKMLIINRLGLKKSDFNQFGLYAASPEKICLFSLNDTILIVVVVVVVVVVV
jgi:hypothetical protein